MIDGKTVLPHQITVSSASEMTSDANSGTDSGGEGVSFALLCYSVINFAESGTSLNPCSFAVYVHVDGSEIEHVEDEERDVGIRDVGNSFIVMTSTSDLHLQVVLLSADYGGLNVGFMQSGDNE